MSIFLSFRSISPWATEPKLSGSCEAIKLSLTRLSPQSQKRREIGCLEEEGWTLGLQAGLSPRGSRVSDGLEPFARKSRFPLTVCLS